MVPSVQEATPAGRPSQSYDPLSRLRDSFLITSRARLDYTQQFSKIYYLRLIKLRDQLKRRCGEIWGERVVELGATTEARATGNGGDQELVNICRVLDLGQQSSQRPSASNGTPHKSVVIGTVYCDMRLKPNVLQDLAREHHLGPAIGPRKWVTPETDTQDSVMLEDESGRVRLVGIDASKWTFVTGLVVGVLGSETSMGDFEVEDVVYSGPPPQEQIPRKLLNKATDQPHGLVAIVSGLDLEGNQTSRAGLRCQSLVEWINGEIGGPEEQLLARSVSRLIIAGNSVRIGTRSELEAKDIDKKKPKRYGYDSSSYTSLPIDHLDSVLSEIHVPIDLMPGPNDPTISSLPQQPLHRCLLPQTNRAKGGENVVHGPNPWWAQIGGGTFLGTSGQNIDDLYKYVLHEDRFKLAKQTLEWGHIAPTAPDTLWCYPFKEHDPFVLSQLPHVYFIGNQPKFETGLMRFPSGSDEERRTRVILVPKFSKSGTLVLVDPVTLECQTVEFLKTRSSNPTDPPNPTSGSNGSWLPNDEERFGSLGNAFTSDDDDDDNEEALPERIVLEMDAGDDDDE